MDDYYILANYLRNPLSHLSFSIEKIRYQTFDGFVAYSTTDDLAVAWCEPLCAMEKEKELINLFSSHWHSKGYKILFLGINNSKSFDPKMFTRYHIADEAEILLPFASNKKIRNAANHARKAGVTISELPNTKENRVLLDEIDREWIADKASDFISFSINNSFAEQINCRLFVAESKGKIIAYSTIYSYGRSPAYWDFTRMKREAPNGVNEFMLETIMSILSNEGVPSLSLGGVPGINVTKTSNKDLSHLLLKLFYEHGSTIYSAKSLFRFKDKFIPQWVPLFAYCSKNFGLSDIPKLFKLFFPSGYSDIVKKRINSTIVRRKASIDENISLLTQKLSSSTRQSQK